MMKETLLKLIENVLRGDERVVFAYAYGSLIGKESFRDVDIAVYVQDSQENPFVITSDIKTELSVWPKKKG